MEQEKVKTISVYSSNPFLFATFANLNDLFRLGAQRPLEQADLGLLGEYDRTSSVYDRFAKIRKASKPDRSLWGILWETVGYSKPCLGLLLQGIACGSAFGPPMILNALIANFSGPYIYPDGQLDKTTLWVLVCLLLVIPVTGVICAAHAVRNFTDISSSVRNALIPAIYRKSMILANSSKQEFSSGMIVNLFGNDIAHLQLFLQQCAEPIFALPQLVIALALIYQQMGNSMFVGMGVVLAVLPLMMVTIGVYMKFRNGKVAQGDVRVKLTNEVLSGIRILKYYAWEGAYADKIDVLREVEIGWLALMNYTMPVFIVLIFGIPVSMPIAIFYTYIRLGNQLDPARAFTTLALFGLITTPVIQIPLLLQQYLTASLSMKRISDFLRADEIVPYVQSSGEILPEGVSVCLRNASLSWTSANALEAEEKEKVKLLEKEKEAQAGKTKSEVSPQTNAQPAQGSGEKEVEMSTLSTTTGSPPQEVSPTSQSSKSLFSSSRNASLNRSIHTLMNINLTVRTCSLVAIVGGVGSGKSSLLYALLGDLYLQNQDYVPPLGEISLPPESSPSTDPAVGLKGSVAYHSQVPWILNANVRDNILFGRPFDQARFDAAIEAACLGPDIAILPKGLDTEIGERGINLSGGQKARVSFCRTVYRDSDVVLLDDPLSAVDAHVAEHIFNKGICDSLVKAGKTVILVTHQIHLLERCDQIVCLEEGAVKAMGTMKEIREMGFDIDAIEPKEEEPEVESLSAPSSPRDRSASASSPRDRSASKPRERTRSSSMSKEPQPAEKPKDSEPAASSPKQEESDGKLMTEEERAEGQVTSEIYLWYLKRGGLGWFISVVLLIMAANGCQSYSAFYLSDWSKDTIVHRIMADYCSTTGYCSAQPLSPAQNIHYLNYYALYSMMYLVGNGLRGVLMAKVGINASRAMHRDLLGRILGASVAFFDTTPMGRILNRFSSDVTQSDERLSSTMAWVLGVSVSLLGLIGSISYTTKGYFLIIIPPLIFLYYRAQRFFRATNTELKRLENISRSPIYSEFQEVLQGVTSLRAFGEQESFIHRMERRVDENTVVMNLQQYCLWWFNIRLDFISGLCSFFVAALAVGDTSLIPLEYLALSLQQSFSLTAFLKMVVTQLALLEAMMSSVERIKFYTENIDVEEPMLLSEYPAPVPLPLPASQSPEQTSESDVEAGAAKPTQIVPFPAVQSTNLSFATPEVVAQRMREASPPPDWPTQGRIEFRDVKLRYRDGPLVLHGLSATIESNEKVGIAGRTGSGKSSLMVALFRIAPLAGGSVWIDGVDISTLPLSVLRSRLGIIPQDPVMFSATVRYNLDPLGGHTDEELWAVLEMVNMKATVESMPGKLDEEVAEGGESLSLGQRQLINIARVILRKPKILVMDEATASIDMDTDALIQDMVREKFKDCTVLTIAHRLHTIIQADRIMVLEKGHLMELDKPSTLIEKPGGLFAGLWAQFQSSHQQGN